MPAFKSPNYPGELKYPLEEADRYKSKIKFQVYEVIPPQVSLELNSADPVEVGPPPPPSNAAAVGKLQVKAIDGEQANLYLPIAFQVSDRMDYQSANLGVVGGAVASGLASGANIQSSLLDGIKAGGQALADAFKMLAGEGGVENLAAVRAAQVIPLEGVRNAIGATAQVTLAPNTRTLFNGVQIRNFAFQFQFYPVSREESLAVKSIIRFFRYHAYPEEIPYGKDFPVGYKYPNLFKIKLMSGVYGPFKNVGTPIKLCYLSSVNHNYNNQSSALHEDGSPTDITLALNFVEYKTISKWDIYNEEFDKFYSYEKSAISDENHMI
jgi:hypothetical protein